MFVCQKVSVRKKRLCLTASVCARVCVSKGLCVKASVCKAVPAYTGLCVKASVCLCEAVCL